MKIAPSLLSADFAALADEVAKIEDLADLLHFDVMDGHFVPNLTVGPVVVQALRKRTRLPLDVHLMIEAPERSIEAFAQAGSDALTVHVEACPHLHRVIQQIKEAGVRAGVALNPATPLSALDWILEEVDLILVMSVNPGLGGQRFLPFVLRKIEALSRRLEGLPQKPEIAVDGGITVENCREVTEAGATVLVAGSAIFGSPDPRAAIERMRQAVGDVNPENTSRN
ncbi:MAG: ribulose-phosphate 3-epimerase [candidate division NC10 bacterium]|nr:ribulose-phosphate 3-epimerase [candidate division NC10 bacterium]